MWKKRMLHCNGVDRSCNITPRESGQTSTRSFMTRTFEEPTKETRQMTADQQTAGAVSHETVERHAIDWRKAHNNVNRLQTRIVKATQEGKWGKVKALQRLLTHSFSGKALAVKRVTENQGRRTPGGDSVSWTTPAARLKAIGTLQRRGYRPLAFPRVHIPKAK